MTGRLLGLIACFMAIFLPASAQRLTVELDGGLQGSHFRLPAGAAQTLPGGSLGLLYTIPLEGPLDILTGITAGVYRTQAHLPDNSTFTNYQVDDQGSAFEYDVKTVGYKETQQFFAAGIPLLLQYHTPIHDNLWYVNAGGKILFPTSDRIDITAGQLSLSGYYPDYNIVLSDVPKHGFGTLNGWKTSTSVPLKPAAALSVSTGIGFPLSNGMELSVGCYVDYGLTGLKSRNDSAPLFTYSPSGVNGTKGNSVLNTPNAGRMNLFAFGLQVRLSLGASARKPAARQAAVPSNQAPPAPLPSNPVPLPSNPAPLPQASVPSSPSSPLSEQESKVIRTPVLFGALGETSLSDMATSHLDDVAAIMQRYPSIRISITGHICNSGTLIENKKIGMARAKAVAEYLRKKGVDKKRMDVGSADESDPVVPNNPAANYLKRRAVISVQ